MTKLWELDDPDLPAELSTVRDIFLPQPIKLPNDLKKSDRGAKEGLHDYLTRKGISCFCRACVHDRKVKAAENNATLL